MSLVLNMTNTLHYSVQNEKPEMFPKDITHSIKVKSEVLEIKRRQKIKRQKQKMSEWNRLTCTTRLGTNHSCEVS